MSQVLIKAVRTGRKTFGNKVDPVTSKVNVLGVAMTATESDTWSSGEHAGDGEYIRVTFLHVPRVDPWPNLKPALRDD